MQKIIPMLCVSDPAKTVEWYESLGYSVTERYPSSGKIEFAFLRFGGAELMVQPRGTRPTDQTALWFYTDRLDEMYSAVNNKIPRPEFLEELSEPFYGGRQF